jgi:hypothetical protein
MFAVLHSDINSLKSGLLYQTGQPYCKKGRSAKVKDGIKNLIIRNYLVDWYIFIKYGNVNINYSKISVNYDKIRINYEKTWA